MTHPLPYAAALKHVPTQQRSMGRVELLLDVAQALLADHAPQELTIRLVTEEAGLPTGTLYQFFDDLPALLQAVALRYLASMPALADALVAVPGDWAELVDATVDAYAEMVRSEPAIRSLWLAGVLDAATQRAEREADEQIAAKLGAAITARAGVDTSGIDEACWVVLVTLIDSILRLAFATDPSGDERLLAEGRRAARAYVGAALGG